MAHAFIAHVDLSGLDRQESEQMLHERVIPMVTQLPGFERGVWLRSEDGATGMGIVVFDSEANAKSAMAGVEAGRSEDAPPVTSTALYEVAGQA